MVSIGVIGCSTIPEVENTGKAPGDEASGPVLACDVPENVLPVGKVVVGHATGTNSEPYVQWGIEQDCFAKYGLEVENVTGTSQAARVAGLIGGSMDVVIQVSRIVVIAMANGELEPLVVSSHNELSAAKLDEARSVREFSGAFIVEPVLVSSPESNISSVATLSDARVGVANVRGNEAVGLLRAVESEGLDPDTIQFVELDNLEIHNALLRGDLDAGSLTGALAISVMEEGGRFLGHTTTYAELPGAQFVWVTTPATYDRNGAAIRAFRDAMWDIYMLLNQQEYRNAMLDFLVERYDLEEDAKGLVPLPDFTPRQATLEELQQWVPELLARGNIERSISLDSSILLTE
jgi:ABC-type nitrate/sulfonate/bicarbonate transport system substrate-binding protein